MNNFRYNLIILSLSKHITINETNTITHERNTNKNSIADFFTISEQ